MDKEYVNIIKIIKGAHNIKDCFGTKYDTTNEGIVNALKAYFAKTRGFEEKLIHNWYICKMVRKVFFECLEPNKKSEILYYFDEYLSNKQFEFIFNKEKANENEMFVEQLTNCFIHSIHMMAIMNYNGEYLFGLTKEDWMDDVEL